MAASRNVGDRAENKRRDVTADISRPSLSASLGDRLIERCQGTLLMEYRIKPPGGINPLVARLLRAKSRPRCFLPASSPLPCFDTQGVVVSRRVSLTARPTVNGQKKEIAFFVFQTFDFDVRFSRQSSSSIFEFS